MAWTKRQIVLQAFSELVLQGYEFDLSPEEIQDGVVRLDLLMSSWDAQSIHLGYALSLSPTEADPDQDSGLPLFSVRAAFLALAMDLAAGQGKALAPTTSRSAKAAYDAMLSKLALDQIERQQYPAGTPKGAGNKAWQTLSQPFMPKPNTDTLQTSSDGGLNFGS